MNSTLLRVRNKGEKWGAINDKGEIVVPLEFEYINHFSENIAQVTVNPKESFYGFIEREKGKHEKNGFIDNKGNVIIPLKYDSAKKFSEGLAK